MALFIASQIDRFGRHGGCTMCRGGDFGADRIGGFVVAADAIGQCVLEKGCC
jgi:hypothetical protein